MQIENRAPVHPQEFTRINADIFCAALQGITANPQFFGSIMQQSPEMAVEFARRCVRAAWRHDGGRSTGPDFTGADGTINNNNFGDEPEPKRNEE